MACKKFENGNKCKLELWCNKKGKRGVQCKFPRHYQSLKIRRNDSDLVKKIKQRMTPKFMEDWKESVGSDKSGKKSMTGGPFEKALREILKERLAHLGVNMSEPGSRLEFKKLGFYIIPDCLIKKKGYPTTIISVKTGFGAEQVRETFAYSYFAKHNYPREKYKVYMAIFLIHDTRSEPKLELLEACKPYIEGIYWMSRKPDIYDLYKQLRETYTKKRVG